MMSRRRLLFAATAVLALAACSPQQQKAVDTAAITIGGPPNIALLAEVAEAKGFFDAERIDATIRSIQTGKLTQDAVTAGQLDFGIVLDVNIASLGFRPGNVRALAVLMTKSDDGLIARRDRGINRPADLSGKTVARLTGTTSHVYIDRLLEQAGVDPARVTFRTMPPPAMQAALIRGEVDAASLWEPFRHNAAAALGTTGLNIDGSDLYTANVLLIRRAPGAAEAEAPEVRVIRALSRAAAFARSNPTEAQAIVAPSLGLPADQVAAFWRFYRFDVVAPDAASEEVTRLGSWVARTQPDFIGKTGDYRLVLGDSAYVRAAVK